MIDRQTEILNQLKQLLFDKKNDDFKKVINENEFDVNFADDNGVTLLMLSVMNKNKEISEFLLQEKSAEVDIADKRGNTALHYAVEQDSNENCLRVLLSNGANPAKENACDFSPFSIAFCGFFDASLPLDYRKSCQEYISIFTLCNYHNQYKRMPYGYSVSRAVKNIKSNGSLVLN